MRTFVEYQPRTQRGEVRMKQQICLEALDIEVQQIAAFDFVRLHQRFECHHGYWHFFDVGCRERFRKMFEKVVAVERSDLVRPGWHRGAAVAPDAIDRCAFAEPVADRALDGCDAVAMRVVADQSREEMGQRFDHQPAPASRHHELPDGIIRHSVIRPDLQKMHLATAPGPSRETLIERVTFPNHPGESDD